MKLKNCTVQELAEIGNEKRIFCFGASFMPQEICEEYGEYTLRINLTISWIIPLKSRVRYTGCRERKYRFFP